MRNAYEIAQRRVKKKKEFLQHLTSFVVIGAFLFAINAATSFGDWWFYFPMLGWSIGLMIHYFNVFGIPGLAKYNEEWEEQAIEKEVERRANLLNIHKTEREYRLARKKIRQQKGFHQHLGAYIAVGLFFLGMNVATSFGDWWFHFPMLGWGIGLTAHFLTVFGLHSIGNYTEKWEARAIEEELERVQKQQSQKREVESDLELRELVKEPSAQKKWDDSQLV